MAPCLDSFDLKSFISQTSDINRRKLSCANVFVKVSINKKKLEQIFHILIFHILYFSFVSLGIFLNSMYDKITAKGYQKVLITDEKNINFRRLVFLVLRTLKPADPTEKKIKIPVIIPSSNPGMARKRYISPITNQITALLLLSFSQAMFF